MATAAAEVGRVPRIQESLGTKIVRALGKTPIHLLLIFLALIWLVPTFGLFITSIAKPEAIGSGAWWKVLSHPSAFTWANYQHMFQNNGIVSALIRTAVITAGCRRTPAATSVATATAPPSGSRGCGRRGSG